MSRLFLLRHAEAEWTRPGDTDFERPLTPGGRAAAEKLGRIMREGGLAPDRVACSSATRARQTWDEVAQSLTIPTAAVAMVDELYQADARRTVEIIRGFADARTLLLISHNPVMEDLALNVPGDGPRTAMEAVRRGFPVAGLAILRFETPLDQIAPGDGFLEAFLSPAD